MTEILAALVLVALLSASSAVGFLLRERLSEEHLSAQNLDALRLVTGLLVTFVALILSLELSSVKATFDNDYRDRGLDAARLAELDQCLRNYGAGTEQARMLLHNYTAAVIASTWPNEPKPVVAHLDTSKMALVGEDPTLAATLNQVGLEIGALQPEDQEHNTLAQRCRDDYDAVQTQRWTVIEDAQGSISPVFSAILSFWLMLVFLSFGLQVPRNPLTVIVLAIGVVAISSVMFVIVDLEQPYGGIFGIPSTSMRDALSDMMT